MLGIRTGPKFVRQVCFIMAITLLFNSGFIFPSIPVSAASSTPIISTIKNVGTQGITSDSLGNVYYVKTSVGSKIYKHSTAGVESEFASLGSTTYQLVTDANDNIYAAANSGLKKIDPQGTVTSISGPTNVTSMALAIDNSGNIYYSDTLSMLKKVDTAGNVTVLASGFNQNMGMAVDSNGNVYVADYMAHVIKKVDTSNNNNVTVIAGTASSSGYTGNGGQASDAKLKGPHNMIISDGQLYFAEYDNYVVRKIDLATGIIDVVAGNGTSGNTGDGGAADAATLGRVFSISKDAFGILYIAAENATKMVYTPGTLSGTVLDTSNNPVNGVTVAIAGTASSTTTDALGSFTLNNVTPGNKKLTVTSAGFGNAEATVAVNDGQSISVGNIVIGAQVSGVTVDKPTLTLTLGGAPVALAATVSPSNAANKSVTWYSNDTNIATVDNNGLVTTVAVGTATITVTTADGSKTATSVVTVTNLAAPAGLTAGAGDGSVTLNWLPTTNSVTYSVYKSTASGAYGSIPEATVSSSTYGYTATGLTNGTTYYFVVQAQYAEGTSGNSNEATATPNAASSGGNGSSGNSGSSGSTSMPSDNGDSGVTILIDGKAENLGTATTGKRNDQTITTIILNQEKLLKKLLAEGKGTIITIPFNVKSDILVSQLNGQIAKEMENEQAVLMIQTDQATYTLPALQINMDSIFRQFGQSAALQDIKIEIEIAAPSVEMMKAVENAAVKGSFTLVAPPIEFTIKASYQGTTIDVSRFTDYVQRTIAIPEGVDPNKITTALVVESDGTVRHVPTKLVLINGRYHASINSMTNSVYVLVWHPLEFNDVTAHWAKSIVNDMGSRMIIEGRGGNMFGPDHDITRAEFAAILVRGLGLQTEIETAPFSDVKASDWFNDVIHTASAYRLISGFEDGTFRPTDKITREQALVMVAKALEVTIGNSQTQNTEVWLQAYADASDVSGWARASIVDCLNAGIVSGRSSTELAPKAYVTRAEVAAIVQRLLQKSDLI